MVYKHTQKEVVKVPNTYQTDLFDGVTCKDEHLTVMLEEQDSVQVLIPELVTDEMTIEFWFKVMEIQNNKSIFRNVPVDSIPGENL